MKDSARTSDGHFCSCPLPDVTQEPGLLSRTESSKALPIMRLRPGIRLLEFRCLALT
jgi:hypothetical protein